MGSLFAASFTVLLSACATSYQADGFSGGFSETQLDTNVFRVSFRGNGHTRAHFVVIDSQSRERHGTYTTPNQSYTTANATAYGNSAYGTAQTTTYGDQTIHISKPSTTNTIMCFKGKQDIQGLVYGAH